MSTPSLLRLFVPACLLAAMAHPALAGQEEPQRHDLAVKPPAVDFGDAYEGEELHKEVVFTNTGESRWPVASIQTSCGCTVAQAFGPDGQELSLRPSDGRPIIDLGSGEALKVDVVFRTAGKHGEVKQQMSVHHQDKTIAPVKVPVHVRVSKGLQVRPVFVNLGAIGKTERIEQTLVVESLEIGPWTIDGFGSLVEGQELPTWMRFEILDDKGPRRRVTMTLDGERPVGAVSARVAILVGHDRIKSVDFTITGMVQPDVVFDTGEGTQDNLSFDQLKPDEKVLRTLKIVNKQPGIPYRLESVDVLTPQQEYFETAVRTLDEGSTYEVDVTVDGAIGKAFFRGSLVLRAQHPDVPNKVIPFHGWVRN